MVVIVVLRMDQFEYIWALVNVDLIARGNRQRDLTITAHFLSAAVIRRYDQLDAALSID